MTVPDALRFLREDHPYVASLLDIANNGKDTGMTDSAVDRLRSEREKDKLRTFMQVARTLATLSTCKRKPCGSLLLPPNFSEIIAIGYNGPPAGLPNDSCPGTEGCGCMHAEENCLVKARRYSAEGLTLMVTRAPCAHCAGLAINSRSVARVVWADGSTAMGEGLALLDRAGIIHWRVE